jgi:hypothetical protein
MALLDHVVGVEARVAVVAEERDADALLLVFVIVINRKKMRRDHQHIHLVFQSTTTNAINDSLPF